MPMSEGRWLLPDGVDEHLPPEATRMEWLRGLTLDLFEQWGYRLCMPPLVEFLDSLLSGVGEDLETQTFKLTDQISGRLLGIPADITPQIARIDAHRMVVTGPQRLCYLGPILHTLPEKFAGSRNPLQVGAELYGHAGIEADAEIQNLMLALLHLLGITDVTLELCHMAIFRELSAAARLDVTQDATLLDGLLRKDRSEVIAVLRDAGVESGLATMFRALLSLNGGPEVVEAARRELSGAPPGVLKAVDDLAALTVQIGQRVPGTDIHLDLAELRGYHYHTGLMFAAYTPTLGRALAWGGRYDNVGAAFGRPRPATGFSADMKLLAALSPRRRQEPTAVFAPAGHEPMLLAEIARLRAAGHRVVQALPEQAGGATEADCAQVLRQDGAHWRLEPL